MNRMWYHFAAPYGANAVHAWVTGGDRYEAHARLVKDDPVWRRGVFIESFLEQVNKYRIRCRNTFIAWIQG